jgi:hypothetical protein
VAVVTLAGLWGESGKAAINNKESQPTRFTQKIVLLHGQASLRLKPLKEG